MTTLTLDQLGKKASDEIKLGNGAIDVANEAHLHAGQHYLKAGKYLLAAKKQVERGAWLPWLKKHGIVERTAQEYMALASNKTTITKVRERKKESMRKIRAQTAPRGADTDRTKTHNADEKASRVATLLLNLLCYVDNSDEEWTNAIEIVGAEQFRKLVSHLDSIEASRSSDEQRQCDIDEAKARVRPN
jgi:hypothetical protein